MALKSKERPTPEQVAVALDEITMKTLGECWDRQATEGVCRQTHERNIAAYLIEQGIEIPPEEIQNYLDLIHGQRCNSTPLTMEKAGLYEERSACDHVRDMILGAIFPGYRRMVARE